MQFYSLPREIEGLAFDIDKTLYDNDHYARNQIDVLIERLALERSENVADTRRAVLRWQEEYAAANEGARQSLGNTFAALGVPIQTSVAWREELIHPERFLQADEHLVTALEELSRTYRLVAVTNNPVRVGRATLETLGVSRFFPHVVGLDTTLRSKPDPAAFRHAVEALACEPGKAVSVGDRYEVDVVPALSIGMGGVLVDGVNDVYLLPRALEGERRLEDRLQHGIEEATE
jgi:phosphoglycolate phosphatase/putative hydrolase of the HAD superfamily